MKFIAATKTYVDRIYDTLTSNLQAHSNNTDAHGLPQVRASILNNNANAAQTQTQLQVNTLLSLSTRTVIGRDSFTRANGAPGAAEVGGNWTIGGTAGTTIINNTMAHANPSSGVSEFEYLPLSALTPILHIWGTVTVATTADQAGIGLLMTVGGSESGYVLDRYADNLVFKSFYGSPLWSYPLSDLSNRRIDLLLNGQTAYFLLDMQVVGTYTFPNPITARRFPCVFVAGPASWVDNFFVETVS